jgi:hypothetical protein
LEIKLATLFDDRSFLLKALEAIKFLASDDPLTKAIRGCVMMEDWRQARLIVRRHFLEMGLVLTDNLEKSILEERDPAPSEPKEITYDPWSFEVIERSDSPSVYQSAFQPQSFQTQLPNTYDDTTLPEVFHYGDGLSYLRGERERYLALSGFSRLGVEDAFEKNKKSFKEKRVLEERTLAEFYLEQGETLKALNLYSKLVRDFPSDSKLIEAHQKLVKMVRLKQQQEPSGESQSLVQKELKMKKLKYLLSQLS